MPFPASRPIRKRPSAANGGQLMPVLPDAVIRTLFRECVSESVCHLPSEPSSSLRVDSSDSRTSVITAYLTRTLNCMSRILRVGSPCCPCLVSEYSVLYEFRRT